MKLAFASDFQLGGGAAYGTPAVPRRVDQLSGMGEMLRLMGEREVTDFVFAGDAFQHRRPDVDALLDFSKFLEALPSAYLMTGNHDVRGPGLATTLDLFRLQAEGVFKRPEVQLLRASDEWPDVALAFLPWAHPGTLRATGKMTPAEAATALAEVAASLRAEVPDDVEAILVTHYALAGMTLPTGLAASSLVGEPVLDTNALDAQGWRYIFAGHIHRPQALATSAFPEDDPAVVSIGSPWVQDFGEATTPHGFWVLNVAEEHLEHVAIPGRPFVTLDWQGLEGYDDWRGASDYDGRIMDAVVRLRWKLTAEEAEKVKVDEVRQALYAHGAHKVYAVQLDVERRARARAEGMADDAEPLVALDAWLEATGSEPRERERLRELTRELLEER